MKTGVAAVISFLTAKSKLQHEYILVLFAAMILDYISGIVAGAITGQLSSQKGIKGILKKDRLYFSVMCCDTGGYISCQFRRRNRIFL